MSEDPKTPEPQNPPPQGGGDKPPRLPGQWSSLLNQGWIWILLVIVGVVAVRSMVTSNSRNETIGLNEVAALVNENRIEGIEVVGEVISIHLNSGNLVRARKELESSIYVSLTNMGVELERLNALPITFRNPPRAAAIISGVLIILPMVVVIAFFVFIMRQSGMGGQNRALQFGRSRAKKVEAVEHSDITFEDVAGLVEAKLELQEVVDFLNEPDKFEALGARIPKGVLLVGSPGTGKTLLAKAVAGEAGVPFFSSSGSEFVEMFVGVGASRVRDLFTQAKAQSPCIIFVDEIDAVGRHRGAGIGGGNDEREQTLNQILVEMDGFESGTNVIVIAATNRPDILDPALLRPGRFDRKVIVDLPERSERKAILEVHAKGKPLDPAADLDAIAGQTPGMVGADLENLMNEAAILAARHDQKSITMINLVEAIERVMAGPARASRVITEKERRYVAYHEAGHAIVMHLLDRADNVGKISVVSRGQALGYVMPLPEEDRHLMSVSDLETQLSALLGGRAAEEIIFQDVTTGAENDLERVTQIAIDMVTRYGMNESLGPIQLNQGEHSPFMGMEIGEQRHYSEEVAQQIDKEVRSLVDRAYQRTVSLLQAHRDQLKLLAETLLEEETLERDEFETLLGLAPT